MFGRKQESLPSEAEIAEAVKLFRRTEPFCRLDCFEGNEGFSASVSFNPCTFQSAPTDFIEIALRSAALRIATKDPSSWDWSESLQEFVKRTVVQATVKDSATRSSATTGGLSAQTEASAQGRVQLPFVAGIAASLKQSIGISDQNTRGAVDSREVTVPVTYRPVEMMRRGDDFELRLNSPGADDLVRLNPDLNRLALLSAKEPSSVDLTSFSVVLNFQIRSALNHSLRIRDAGGKWASLVASRNKTIVSELLLEKFLRPAHKPLRLWPKRGVK